MGNFPNFDLFCVPVATTKVKQMSTPPPGPKVIHKLHTRRDNLWITWGATLARFVHGLTSVWTCVGPHRLARLLLRELSITRAHATSIRQPRRAIVYLWYYLLFTSWAG